MTTLPKHLEEMRQFWLGQRSIVHNGIQSHVEFLIEMTPTEGFTHVIERKAIDIMLKDMEEMAKALEEIAEMTYDSNLGWGGHAKEALKNYREKYGESNDQEK